MYVREEGVVSGLVPNTTYVFLVRAKNNHGLGGPSQLSDLVRTLRKLKYLNRGSFFFIFEGYGPLNLGKQSPDKK